MYNTFHQVEQELDAIIEDVLGDEPPNDIACCMSSECLDFTDSKLVATNMFNIVVSHTCSCESLHHPTSSKLSYCASPFGATDFSFVYNMLKNLC